MANLQLLLSIGIPSVLIGVGIVLNQLGVRGLKADMNRQFDKVDARFEKVDARFEKIEARLGRIDEDLRMFHDTDKELEGRVNELSARIR